MLFGLGVFGVRRSAVANLEKSLDCLTVSPKSRPNHLSLELNSVAIGLTVVKGLGGGASSAGTEVIWCPQGCCGQASPRAWSCKGRIHL